MPICTAGARDHRGACLDFVRGLLSTSTPLLSAGAGSTKVVVEDPGPETSPIEERVANTDSIAGSVLEDAYDPADPHARAGAVLKKLGIGPYAKEKKKPSS